MRSWMTSLALTVACGAAVHGSPQDSGELRPRFCIDGKWYEHHAKPLTANTAYLFDEVIQREVRELTKKKESGTWTDVDEASKKEYCAMIRIWKKFQFMDRIMRGDMKIAEDSAHEKENHLRVRVGNLGTDGRCRIENEVVDSKYVLLFGDKALVVSNEEEVRISSMSIVTLREGTKKQLEDYTKVHIQRVKARNMLDAVDK